MTKKEAIRLLTEQKQIFDSRAYSDKEIWRQKTASLIEQFLGLESSEYYSFTNFDFRVIHLSSEDIDYKAEFKRKHEIMSGLLGNCIDKLKISGIYKKTQRNIVSHLDNWALILIATSIFIAGITSGIWLNDTKSFGPFSALNSRSNDNSNSKITQTEKE